MSHDIRNNRPRHVRGIVRVALALSASVLAALPLIAAPGVITITSWATTSALVALLAWHPGARRTEPGPAAEPLATVSGDEPVSDLLGHVLPVWLHHLGSVKTQSEQAVNELVSSFASLNRQFDDAGFIGDAGIDGKGQATFSLLTLCERELRPVVRTMSLMLDSKSALVKSVNELAEATQELQGMARDVGRIASHTNILAINAAVEAAHAGDAGRGFSVIANEIRKLSQSSAATGKKIADRMAQVERITRATVQTASEASENDREVIEMSGSVVQDVLEHVREMGRNADRMREKGLVIRRDTENLLVNLQFQDRMSQILNALDQDMQRMQQATHERAMLPAPAEWLDRLATTYTMDDQRNAGMKAPATQSSSAPADEVVFF